jgi:polyphosphate kinase
MPETTPTPFLNRDLSWLEFNRRVLEEGADPRNPVIERVNFLQIFNSNLDEFFMKRVGGLKRQLASPTTAGNPAELLAAIRKTVEPMLLSYGEHFTKGIQPELEKAGIRLVKLADLNAAEEEFATQFFYKNIFPVLTPLAVDPGHPFPFISNLSVSFGVLMRHPDRPEEELFARIKVPPLFPTWLRVSGGEQDQDARLLSLYELIGHNLGSLFPGMHLLHVMMFRVTRNADIERDEEDAEDLLELIAEELRERKFAKVVRLEHGPNPNAKILAILADELELVPDDIFQLPLWLEYFSLGSLSQLNRPELKFPPWIPVTAPQLADPDIPILDLIKKQDILVHHPYDSFSTSVERFIRSAVEDKHVIAIKMTLYRTGEDSPFIPFLIRAAEMGKQVVCLVELKARFDEERNILVAQALEKAGVHVVYGIVGFKTHCKLALVLKQEADGVRSYVHIGTGNYHAKTSRLYTDLGLFTSKPEFTDDVVHLFHYLTGRSLHWNFRKLLIAPIDMKQTFLRLIDREIYHKAQKKPARIIVKVNNLEDPEIIQSLYHASQAGVAIDLLVRTVCCLTPQVKGLSENIRVYSVVGRYLEHSRIYYFQNGVQDPSQGEVFIGSADWMSRNLVHRVEAATPIEDPAARAHVWEILSVLISDVRQSWELHHDGTYQRCAALPDSPKEAAQEILMKQTKEKALSAALSPAK